MYDGFQIECGCTCKRCGSGVLLEGLEDADGQHYCPSCDDYVSVNKVNSDAHSANAIKERERVIKQARKHGEIG